MREEGEEDKPGLRVLSVILVESIQSIVHINRRRHCLRNGDVRSRNEAFLRARDRIIRHSHGAHCVVPKLNFDNLDWQ